MSIEKDIQRLFSNVLEKFNGNKAAAAASLGVNSVTFWGWTTGKRKPPKALCEAIDSAGGKLFAPGELPDTPSVQTQKIESLQKDIEHLRRENELLQKLVNKYEHDEREKNEAPEKQEVYANGSIQPSNIHLDSATETKQPL